MCKKPQWSGHEQGQGLVEYALILILVSVAAILIVALLGEQITSALCGVVRALDENAVNSIAACQLPPVTCSVQEISSGAIRLEAVPSEDIGPVGRVDFYDNGGFVRHEYEVHYCLGGGNDAPCNEHSPSSSGSHTFRAVVYDSASGGTAIGECTVSVSIP